MISVDVFDISVEVSTGLKLVLQQFIETFGSSRRASVSPGLAWRTCGSSWMKLQINYSYIYWTKNGNQPATERR